MKKLIMALLFAGASCMPAFALADTAPAATVACTAPDVYVYASRNNQIWQGNVKLLQHRSCGVEAVVVCEFAPTGFSFLAPFGNDVKAVGEVSSSACQYGWIVKSIDYRWWNGQAWVLH